jgi:hypothetical protein
VIFNLVNPRFLLYDDSPDDGFIEQKISNFIPIVFYVKRNQYLQVVLSLP